VSREPRSCFRLDLARFILARRSHCKPSRRTPRLVAALVLSFSGVIGASACVQEPDISPETSQTMLEADTDEAIATVADELGEFSSGSIGGSDFGHLDLGATSTSRGPGPVAPWTIPRFSRNACNWPTLACPRRKRFVTRCPISA
jgi:hypothetical protein